MTLDLTGSQLAASFFDQQPQPAFWMTPVFNGEQVIDFEYRYCNEEFYIYTGLTPDIVIGNRLSTSAAIADPAARKKLFSELLNVYQNGHRPIAWIYNNQLNKYY